VAVTRDQAMETLLSLGVGAIFIQSYLDKDLPDGLEMYFRPPEEFFLAPDTQEPYTHGRLIPLLDNGSFSLVLFYDPDSKSFVRKYIEDPDDAGMQSHYKNWQQYLVDLMIDMVEAEEDDERLKKMAERIEFSRLDEVIDFVESMQAVDYEEKNEQTLKFIRKF
jgi:hypothetical protein